MLRIAVSSLGPEPASKVSGAAGAVSPCVAAQVSDRERRPAEADGSERAVFARFARPVACGPCCQLLQPGPTAASCWLGMGPRPAGLALLIQTGNCLVQIASLSSDSKGGREPKAELRARRAGRRAPTSSKRQQGQIALKDSLKEPVPAPGNPAGCCGRREVAWRTRPVSPCGNPFRSIVPTLRPGPVPDPAASEDDRNGDQDSSHILSYFGANGFGPSAPWPTSRVYAKGWKQLRRCLAVDGHG